MSKVFISYRRSDTQMAAGRLRESLSNRLGGAAIFRDKDSIAGGTDWIRAIEDSLKAADVVVLALIGPDWLSARDDAGKRRLDDPEDWNRLELEHALRLGRTVIPVLVDNATMPPAAELPESLKALARSNAVKLRDDDWETDVDRLGRLLGMPAKAGADAVPHTPAQSRSPRLIGAVIAALLVALGAGGWFYASTGTPAARTLSGSWAMTHFNDDGSKHAGTLALQQSGQKLTGTVAWAPKGLPREISNGSVKGTTVEFEAVGPRGAKRVYQGDLDSAGNLIQGAAKGGASAQAEWTAARQSAAATAAR
jgi:hypothetical protein